jgi:CBS domain containing-hemolysin-like protein
MDPSPGLTLATIFADFGMILFALILVLLNGFFVAAEFAMVKLRSTRVEAIAEQHGWRGHILRTVHSQLDAYLSACQLGITLASLGLGWVGEPAFAHILEPVLETIGVQSAEVIKAVSFFTAFFIISYLHIVVGELAPKSWAIRKPELLSLWTCSTGPCTRPFTCSTPAPTRSCASQGKANPARITSTITAVKN